jgi:hypothetical protein
VLDADRLLELSVHVAKAENWQDIASFRQLRNLALLDVARSARYGLAYLAGHPWLQNFSLTICTLTDLRDELAGFCSSLPRLKRMFLKPEQHGSITPGDDSYMRSLLHFCASLERVEIGDYCVPRVPW